jgi:hypothetical protein
MYEIDDVIKTVIARDLAAAGFSEAAERCEKEGSRFAIQNAIKVLRGQGQHTLIFQCLFAEAAIDALTRIQVYKDGDAVSAYEYATIRASGQDAAYVWGTDRWVVWDYSAEEKRA